MPPNLNITRTSSMTQVGEFLSHSIDNLIETGNLHGAPRRKRKADTPFDKSDGWLEWAQHISGFASLAGWHRKAWAWAWKIQANQPVDPLVIIAPRGSGKSSCAENIAVALGALEKRRFVLYLRASQEQANASVANIAALLESPSLSRHFPDMSERSLTKFGQSKGWNRQIVRTASGFSVLGHGLDTALRGVKLENFRPDLIICDDIDEISDSPLVTERKIAHITKSVLPAGSPDVIVLAVQNLVIKNGVFARLAQDKPEFLSRRTLIGPIPAIQGLEYDVDDYGKPFITAGKPTWPEGQGLEVCEKQMNDWGISAFLNEAQHDLEGAANGMFSEVDFDQIEVEDGEVPPLNYVICAVDPAVTSGKRSHAQAICIDGVGPDENGLELIYRLFAWEGIDSPDNMLTLAIVKACEFGAKEVAIEVNQGGSLWESSFLSTARALFDQDRIGYIPRFVEVRATANLGDKESRAQSMLSDYQRHWFRHVAGRTNMLTKALKRFPLILPDDLTDASYWSWSKARKMMKNTGGGEAKIGRIPRDALLGTGDKRRAANETIQRRFRGGRVALGGRR
jgi:hypothetical protein